jgi:ABC-type glutathione transport system ATPase component
MWDIIKQLVSTGTTILLTTQDMDEADHLADRIIVINGGKIIAEGTSDELKQRIGSERLEIAVAAESSFEKAKKVIEDDSSLRSDDKMRTLSLVTKGGILFSLAISWISAIMGLLVKSMEAAQWTGFIVIFPLTFVSSAFVPTETMPYALRLFAENQPLTHVIEAIRAWLVGTSIGNSGWLAFAWCIGIIIVSMPVATWLFKRQALR